MRQETTGEELLEGVIRNNLHFTKLTQAAVWGINCRELKSGGNKLNEKASMENYGLVSAGGDRGGEKELDSRRILVVKTD